MTVYKKGDLVEVLLPGGWVSGRVHEVKENWGFPGKQETKYEVHGTKVPYITLTSERSVRHAKR